ncbi:MAG: xanthine dehydrogenase family protein molybdopterin-binding subunit [Spirochaetaceae bacterium]|nr:xanthine dehydrogenase family protein molybdopterin-binding subunit [Spirochaetaceae bacterium]
MFIDDIDLPGALVALTLRSPVARGTLLGIEAPRLPPGYWLIRAEDIPGKNALDEMSVPVLAGSHVSYAGEPVALLVGTERHNLEEIARNCRVRTERETPLWGGEHGADAPVLARRRITAGSTERAFSDAKDIIEAVYSTGSQEHWYSEPAGALAVWSGEGPPHGRLTIHAATQWAFHVRGSVAGALGVPADRITVEPSSIGMHLDGKIWYPSLLACQAALAAFITGKSVRIMLSREEDFRYSPKRFPAEIRIRSALGEGGKLLAQEVSAVCELGAYGVFTDEILDRVCLGALGVYRQANVRVEGTAAAVNLPPMGPFMGFGLAQGFFAMESHAGHIVNTLGLNPVTWRRENAINMMRPLAIGAPLQDDPYIEKLIDTAAAMGDFNRKWASYETLRQYRRTHGGPERGEVLRGAGIAAAYQSSGFLYPGADRGVYSVELTLDKNSELEIRTSMVSSSREYINIWQNLAAEILSIDREAVRIVSGNTDLVPDAGPSALSRNITTITHLVELACQAIRKQRFRDPLPITVRRSTRPAKIASWNHPERNGAENSGPPPPVQIDQNAFAHTGFGAAVVEVEIDPVEYTPHVRGVWIALNGGKILSQKQAWRSVRYSVVQALGWASREIIAWEDGVIPAALFKNYNIADPGDAPPIYIDFIWNDSTPPNGIDELAFNCVPAAWVQAVSQAMDHSFCRIPVTARDIWNAAEAKKNEEKS